MLSTGPLAVKDQDSALPALSDIYDPIDQQVELNSIRLARQEVDQPFVFLNRLELRR